MSDTVLKIGSKAPAFTLKSHDGANVALKDFLDKKSVVLVFYPGDMTPGCTIQLCGIRDHWSKFSERDTAVFGINHADAASHAKFADKYHFPFPLLVDPDKKVAKKYGAIRKLFSATIVKRTVVAIDKTGKIVFYRHGMPKEADVLKTLNQKTK